MEEVKDDAAKPGLPGFLLIMMINIILIMVNLSEVRFCWRVLLPSFPAAGLAGQSSFLLGEGGAKERGAPTPLKEKATSALPPDPLPLPAFSLPRESTNLFREPVKTCDGYKTVPLMCFVRGFAAWAVLLACFSRALPHAALGVE